MLSSHVLCSVGDYTVPQLLSREYLIETGQSHTLLELSGGLQEAGSSATRRPQIWALPTGKAREITLVVVLHSPANQRSAKDCSCSTWEGFGGPRLLFHFADLSMLDPGIS